MRDCIRCGSEMMEDLDIKVDMQGYGIRITKLGIFSGTIEKPKAAVCPKCGEISLYIENVSTDRPSVGWRGRGRGVTSQRLPVRWFS